MKEPIRPKEQTGGRKRDQMKSVIDAIKLLLDNLAPEEQEIAINQINEYIRPIPVDKGGELLTYLAKILPTREKWSVEEIRVVIRQSGLQAETKEIYNAIGYLNRKNHIKKIGYGRYLVNGAQIDTAEDWGGEGIQREGEHGG